MPDLEGTQGTGDSGTDPSPARRVLAPTMASNLPVTAAGCEYGCAYLLLILLPIILLGLAWIAHLNLTTDTAIGAMLGTIVLLGVTIGGLRMRYWLIFVGAALHVPSGVAREDIPRIVVPATPLFGEPELEIRARVRSLLGRAGTCRIELYGNGIRIWRGPGRADPSWSFAYADLLQAEPTTLIGAAKTPNQTFLRLIVTRPRMAFLIASGNRTDELIRRLADHHVITIADA